MKKLGSKGFGIVEGLLVVVIIGMIGGIGYYIYQNKDTASAPTYSDNLKPETVKSELPDVTTTLEIKEWGVKLDIEGVKNPIYKIGSGVAWISTESYENLPECREIANQINADSGENSYEYFQGIARLKASNLAYGAYPEDTETMAELYQAGNDRVKKIGDYYYNYTHGNGIPCSDQPQPDYLKAFQTLTAI